MISLEQLIKDTLIDIVTKKYFVRLECEGFNSHYDMSGQRTCYLVQTFNHTKLDEYPLLLGLIREDYVAFWKGHQEKGKFWKDGEDKIYYRDINQKDCIIGQVTITEAMIKNATILLTKESGCIQFKHMQLNFRKSN